MHAKQELELSLMLPGKLHVCREFSKGNSFVTPKMLNGVIFISREQILGEKIMGSYRRYPMLPSALWSILCGVVVGLDL